MTQTIALIDDDRNILTSISIALEKEGFKVQTYRRRECLNWTNEATTRFSNN